MNNNNNNNKRLFQKVSFTESPKVTLLILFAVMIIVFTIASPQYISIVNLKSILSASSIYGILLTGIVLVMIAGGFDLSIGSQVGFIGVVIAKLFRLDIYIPIWLIFIIALILGMVIGLVNGTIITRIGVNPLITTLGTMAMLRGLAYIWADEGAKIYHSTYINITRGYLFNVIPYSFLFVVVLFLIFSFILKFTRFGRNIYLVGGNEQMARLAGVSTNRIKIITYVFSGLFSAIAAILMTGMLASGLPANGQGLEIEIALIAIIGGITLGGGKGDYLGSFIALLFLGSITNGLVMMGATGASRMIAKGLILVLAISFDAIRNRRNIKEFN